MRTSEHGGWSVGPAERFEDEELQRLDREARVRLIALLEAGEDPQTDEPYREMERRVDNRRAELGMPTR